MARLEKVKIEKVWADEIFYASNTATVDVTAPPGCYLLLTPLLPEMQHLPL